MQKLFLIIFIVCTIVGINSVVLAEVKFGSWEKWDEELPSADSKDWNLVIERGPKPIHWEPSGGDIIILTTPLFFSSSIKERLIVTFYFSGDINIKDWDSAKIVTNATFALAVFPPERKKCIVRAYKKDKGIFKFFEEWKIPFKNDEPVVLEDVKFRQIFREFIVEQMKRIKHQEVFQKVSEEKFSAQFLPHLDIRDKTFYIQVP